MLEELVDEEDAARAAAGACREGASERGQLDPTLCQRHAVRVTHVLMAACLPAWVDAAGGSGEYVGVEEVEALERADSVVDYKLAQPSAPAPPSANNNHNGAAGPNNRPAPSGWV